MYVHVAPLLCLSFDSRYHQDDPLSSDILLSYILFTSRSFPHHAFVCSDIISGLIWRSSVVLYMTSCHWGLIHFIMELKILNISGPVGFITCITAALWLAISHRHRLAIDTSLPLRFHPWLVMHYCEARKLWRLTCTMQDNPCISLIEGSAFCFALEGTPPWWHHHKGFPLPSL